MAKRMIVDGRMPTPEQARRRLEREQERGRLGEPFFMDPLKRAFADAESLATDMAARAYTLMIKKL
jgi:hypothetical protein